MLCREPVIPFRKYSTVCVSGGIMSGPGTRPRFLEPSEISELIVTTDSDKVRGSSNSNSVEGGS